MDFNKQNPGRLSSARSCHAGHVGGMIPSFPVGLWAIPSDDFLVMPFGATILMPVRSGSCK